MIFTEPTIYKQNGAKQHLPGFEDRFENIVDYILKITEEIWEQRAIWVIYDTYGTDIPVHIGAGTIFGVEEVVKGTLKTLSSFPDRKMGGEAVIWSNVGANYFYSSHRIGSTATNHGDTDFGKASGRKVFFRTIADCLITENKIVEEWLVRDNLHLVQQLGFDPVEMAKRDSRYKNKQQPSSAASALPRADLPSTEVLATDPAAALITALFENAWIDRDFSAFGDFYHSSATAHMICEKDLTGPLAIGAYVQDLLACFSESEMRLERITSNINEGETEVAARWKIRGIHTGDGLFGPASGKELVLPGISHFIVSDNKVTEEWTVFDAFDLLCQIHADEAPKPAAHLSSEKNIHLHNKEIAFDFFQDLNKGGEERAVFEKYLAPDVVLNVTRPYKEMIGLDAYASQFWFPLHQAFPDLEIQPYILVAGEYEGRNHVSSSGNFIGTFTQDWLGIPATNQPLWIRFAAHFIIEKDRITHAWFFLDMIDVLRQAGFNFFPTRGIQHTPPPPMTGDGIVLYETKQEESQYSLDLTNAMLNGLGAYDGKTLESMAQERFWDVQNMMWYGPSGIGTTRGLKGFQANHQIPFLLGFPDRGITPKQGKIYFSQIGDGNYSCDFGFPAMYGTHKGDGWLGLKATGKKITLRVVDYWRREGGQLKENWVLIDIVDILEQLGVDVFDLMRKEIQKNKNGH